MVERLAESLQKHVSCCGGGEEEAGEMGRSEDQTFLFVCCVCFVFVFGLLVFLFVESSCCCVCLFGFVCASCFVLFLCLLQELLVLMALPKMTGSGMRFL